ncbi:DEAD/DEAH box helicase [Paenibacillus xylanexedens]|uniref:DEAD/DEAH box helicase n=1 Tax=Paenibacillus xylanexedens TaxID=528191 RepID=UPI000F54021E|nr:hypothetical protein [Paenibacillus xylanexedens]RPK23993.1 hypothetical protein EDO6_04931 [Paenibacillus xylanexedens]
MQIENIHNGFVAKNYRHMCSLLGEVECTGKSKQLQLKRWKCYFNYEKIGNKMVVTEVYEKSKPLPKRGGNNVKFKRLTVTDLLGNEVEQWQQGEIITIEAGTGVGKSYFIKNTLYEKAKREGTKILFLVNRSRLKEQFEHELERDGKSDIISVFLYQEVEARLRRSDVTFKSEYKYIVSDEFHYFLNDSPFNSDTEDSFKMILSDTTKTKIFMSATADMTIEFFKFKGIEYRSYNIPHNYRHIKELLFYRDEKVLEKFLSKIRKNQKVICFTKKAERAYDLHKRFEDSLFVCSETGGSGYKKYVDKEKVKKMLAEETIEEKFLFTTSTLDNGINLRGKDIKYIVCDIHDVDTLIQCLGRKRIIDAKDQVTIVIRNITDKELQAHIREKEKIINPATYLMQYGVIKYIEKYPKHYKNPIIYDKLSTNKDGYGKVVNEIRYFKETYDKKFYENMLLEESGYMNYIKNKLQQSSYVFLDEYHEKSTINDYLDELMEKRLYKQEQDILVKKVGLKDARGRLQRSPEVINPYFDNNDIPYKIIDKNIDQNRKLPDGTKNTNFKKSYWTIVKYILNRC